MALRLRYARTVLARLNIETVVQHKEKLPKDGQYLLIANHRSIIDPLLVEIALAESSIDGYWIAKKELYNSFFFGLFTRNAGSIVLDRDTKVTAPFFKAVKAVTQQGHSVFVFPEGTRNKGNTTLIEFKAGSRLIALKNRINILPLYISTNADEVLKEAIYKRTKNLKIVVEVGDLIEYRSKEPLDQSYRKMFNIR
ncbi:MAG: lysophospholipid acyltransferase family protein [Halopseudomonas sp.]